MNVELVKATAEQNTRRYDEKKGCYVGEHFGRGERIILVDGVRWGRTYVTFHGCHGTTHTFKQDHGHIIQTENGITDECVRSRTQLWRTEDGPTTEQVVLQKACELIESGRLRDPKIVQEENEAAHELYLARCAALDAKQEQAFREKAREALGLDPNELHGVIIDRVVDAMRWAQTQ